jgi:hypothetical protein
LIVTLTGSARIMPDETIQVVFKPVAANGWHETLVYTARDGHQEFASAYASNQHPRGNEIGDVSGAVSGASHNHRGGGSAFGTLETESDRLAPADKPMIFGPPGGRLPAETVAHGADLSRQWSEVKNAYREVGDRHFTYSPLTQNSNSAATTAMVAAGITPPHDNGLTSHHWTPAADNVLPIPATAHKQGAIETDATRALAAADPASLWRQSAGVADHHAAATPAASQTAEVQVARAATLRA